MRIGLIHHQFVPRGGMERYLIEFAERLAAAGHELQIVTADVAPDLEERIEAEWRRVPLVRGSPLLRMWQFDRIAAGLAPELGADVTIGFGRTTTQDLHRAGGGCHRVYSELLPWWRRWSLKNRLELHLEKRLHTEGRTKRFVTNSEMIARQLGEAYGVAGNLMRVIRTPVDTEHYRPARDRATLRAKVCAQTGGDPGRPAFLFVSLNHRRKGLDVLLELWPEVDADLWIVGKPPSRATWDRIVKLGIARKVRCIAAQSNMISLYQTADWLVHPTLYDACANSVLQSMACGLPGLISSRDGASEFVRDGANGFLLGTPRDAAAVHAAVTRALATPEDRRRAMGAAARESMMPLTWERHLGEWMDLIGAVRA